MSEQHQINSKFGALVAVLTDANHAHVSTAGVGITVNKVEYHVNCHLYRWSDGTWHIGQEGKNQYEQRQSLHMTRKNWVRVNDMYPSRAAFDKAAPEIRQAFVDFVHANPVLATEAQWEHLQDALESAESKYAEALAAADEARKVRDAAQAAFDSFVREAA
jgi:hypothetical protein